MEKRSPHYPLSQVKDLIREGRYRATRSSLRDAANGYGLIEAAELAKCVLELGAGSFYKSMTTLHDASIWQDVYRSALLNPAAYIKLQVTDGRTVIISFKPLEDG